MKLMKLHLKQKEQYKIFDNMQNKVVSMKY